MATGWELIQLGAGNRVHRVDPTRRGRATVCGRTIERVRVTLADDGAVVTCRRCGAHPALEAVGEATTGPREAYAPDSEAGAKIRTTRYASGATLYRTYGLKGTGVVSAGRDDVVVGLMVEAMPDGRDCGEIGAWVESYVLG